MILHNSNQLSIGTQPIAYLSVITKIKVLMLVSTEFKLTGIEWSSHSIQWHPLCLTDVTPTEPHLDWKGMVNLPNMFRLRRQQGHLSPCSNANAITLRLEKS